MRISDWSSDVCSSDLITGVLCMAYTQPAFAQEKRGVIPHAPLLRTAVPDTANQAVAVYHVEYEPGGINPRHLHPAAVTFHILSCTRIWKEEGTPPFTLRAGDRLLVSAGTIHPTLQQMSTQTPHSTEFIVDETAQATT